MEKKQPERILGVIEEIRGVINNKKMIDVIIGLSVVISHVLKYDNGEDKINNLFIDAGIGAFNLEAISIGLDVKMIKTQSESEVEDERIN